MTRGSGIIRADELGLGDFVGRRWRCASSQFRDAARERGATIGRLERFERLGDWPAYRVAGRGADFRRRQLAERHRRINESKPKYRFEDEAHSLSRKCGRLKYLTKLHGSHERPVDNLARNPRSPCTIY